MAFKLSGKNMPLRDHIIPIETVFICLDLMMPIAVGWLSAHAREHLDDFIALDFRFGA
jgi:hypothetical protein